jgi:hypothetical protein
MDLRRNLPRRVSLLPIPPLTPWIAVILLVFTADVYGQILTLTPSLSLGERYDDNIFQNDNDKVYDFVTIITPGVNLHYVPTTDIDLTFEYLPSFQIFARNPDENFIGHRLLFDFAFPLSRILSLGVSDGLIITQEPGDRTVDIDQATGLREVSQQRRGRTVRNTANAFARAQLAPRTTLGLSFDSLYEDVENPTQTDSFDYGFQLDLGYLTNVKRENRASLHYDLTFYTFRSNVPGPDIAGLSDFRVHTWFARYRRNFTSTLVGEASLGYSLTQSDAPDLDGNSGVVGGVSIIKTLRTGEARLSYERRFGSARSRADRITIDRVVAVFSSNITPKVFASLGGNVSFFDYQRDTFESRLFFTIRPSLAYQALRFWRLSVDYAYAFSDFDEPARANRINHRLAFASQFTLRSGLFLTLTYRYRVRVFGNGIPGDVEYHRNEVLLTLTYAPTFRVYRK